MHIRAARLDDAEAIRAIYNHEVQHSTAVFDVTPRSLAEQQTWLQSRSGAHAVLVAEIPEEVSDSNQVVGFAALSPYRPRAAYNGTVENSVYVHHQHRGAGIGRALLVELLSLARSHGFHTVVAHVAGGNEASVVMHQSVGFQVVGVEREVGRKFNRWLDVVLMQVLLPDWEPPAE